MVVEGQVIGLMGNSGISDAPHLHFQVVTDSPVFLGAEGYPLIYRSFNVTGKVDESSQVATFFKEPFHRKTGLWRIMQ
jgi:murein DD-endopeptidase MepM/ murein hydrolase activator NlpD